MPKVTLSYEEVFRAAIGFNMLDSMKLPFPVQISKKLAKMHIALRPHIEVIDKVRRDLAEKHAPSSQDEKDAKGKIIKKGGKKMPILRGSPEEQAFNAEWGQIKEDKVEVELETVKLPEKIASTCDKCHHNMEKPLLLDYGLIELLDKFIEI